MSDINEIELTDEELDEYLAVAFAMGNTTGFSKGTANVSAADLKKLRPLIRFYAKKPHPFRACVQDNTKRFGPLVNKYCAIIKDLIEGNTKWRHGGKKTSTGKNLSDEALKEMFELSVPVGFGEFLSELTDEEVAEMMAEPEESAEFAQGQVAWDYKKGEEYLRNELEAALNPVAEASGDTAYSGYGMRYWVKDTNEVDSTALVCQGGDTYWVVPFTVDKKNSVTISPEDQWKPVEQAWVQANFADETGLMAEMYFADKTKKVSPDKEGLIWKPIIREGTWKFSPGSGQQAKPKPIKIVAEGKSDRKNLVISLAELKSNFESGAKEHVTIPTSHKDGVLENTGFVRKVRISKDDQGRAVLEAGHDFTEPDVKDKALRGTIANTSAGILFDYIHKESGKKYGSVLAHVALTNHPWLNGMKPFGVNASEENLEVISFSEEPIEDPAHAGGGEGMSEVAFDFSELGFNSREELELALAERKTLKAKDRERDVADRCRKWQEDGKSPALVAEAQAIMMSDEGAAVLNLSEDGKQVGLSATDIVERLVSKSASVKLTQDPVDDAGSSKDGPEDGEEIKLTQEERVLATQLFFEGNLSEEKAVEEAKRQIAAKTGGK
jgi:hypothetical protein